MFFGLEKATMVRVIRRKPNRAFQKNRRAMSAMDVIAKMGGVLDSMEEALNLALE